MKTKNIILIALLVLLTGMGSCKKDHDIPTGKVFNGGSGGGNSGGGEEPENGDTTYEYVDLGLPSGLLWATCNVGADSPEKYGDYFAWGETQPKETYRWDTYRHGGLTTLIKYCNDANFGYNGFTDNLAILLPEDDAASANWGNDWRMPTEEEWKELYENTTSQWTTLNGENGRLFTAENGSSLFLPAAGSYDDMGLYYTNSRGHYWSSSLYSSKPSQACMNDFYSSEGSLYSSTYRYVGLSVRPVRSSSQNYTIITSANPANGGTVSGGGTYQQGQTCTVTVIVEAGYTFVNWTENGSVVSTSANYSFTVTDNRTLVANFQAQPQNYTISLLVNSSDAGTVSGGGAFQQGQTCTVHATPAGGYTFVRWTENGTQVSANTDYTFTVTGNRTLVANFELSDYSNLILNELNGNDKFIEIYNASAGAINMNGVYIEKDGVLNWIADNTVIIEASGYLLLYSEDVQIDHLGYPENMFFHSNISAKKNVRIQLFTPAGVSIDDFNMINIDLNGEAYGYANNQAPASYSRNTDGNWYYADATPGRANVNGLNPVLGLEGGYSPGSSFFTISVSANPSDGGLVIGGGAYQEGLSCTVTATPKTGFAFVDWTENGIQVSDSENYTFTVMGNRALVANFILYNNYSNIILNELNGDTKFIEIYNKGDMDLSLEGMYIMKDDYVAGAIWTAEAAVVAPAHGYVLLYSEDVTPIHPDYPEHLFFHSGMSSKKTCRYTLFLSDGTVCDEFIRGTTGAWGVTISNVTPLSFARTPDGGDWKLADPTPGEANPATGDDIPQE